MPVIRRADAVSYICEQLGQKRCILFLGSGVSATYEDPTGREYHGLPTGRDLLQHLAESREYVTPDMSLIQALTMKLIYEHRRGLLEFIGEHVPQVVTSVLPAYLEIAKLPLSAIVTTNWDLYTETALQQARINFHVIVQDSDIPIFRPTSVPVVKFHGTIDRPDTIVATLDDILDLFARRPVLSSLLRVLCAQGTVLFLGYALEDPDFRDLYRGLQRELGDFMPASFAIQLESSKESIDFWSHQGISIIESDVTDFLQRINTRLFLERATALRGIGNVDEWTSDPFLRELIGAGSLPTEGRVVDGVLRQLARMLEDENASLDYISKTLPSAIKTLIRYRPTYQVLRKLEESIIPEWFGPEVESKQDVRRRLDDLLQERQTVKGQIAEKGAEFISSGDKLLIYSQSTRVVDAIRYFLRNAIEREDIELVTCERLHKSPGRAQDALSLAEAIGTFVVPVHIIPDASLAYVMGSGQITKVFLGAHSVRESPEGTLIFTNTTGTLMIAKLAAVFGVPVYVLAEEAKVLEVSEQEEISPREKVDQGEWLPRELQSPELREMLKARRIEYFNPGWDTVSSADVPFTLITEGRVVTPPK